MITINYSISICNGRNLQLGDEYAFFLVLSTDTNTSEAKQATACDACPREFAATKDKVVSKEMGIMPELHFIYSVETRFVFALSKCHADIGLRAHRIVLAKYSAFDQLIKQALNENNATQSAYSL